MDGCSWLTSAPKPPERLDGLIGESEQRLAYDYHHDTRVGEKLGRLPTEAL